MKPRIDLVTVAGALALAFLVLVIVGLLGCRQALAIDTYQPLEPRPVSPLPNVTPKYGTGDGAINPRPLYTRPLGNPVGALGADVGPLNGPGMFSTSPLAPLPPDPSAPPYR